VVLSLTLWGLPNPSTGADVQRYLEIVRSAAQTVTKSLASAPASNRPDQRAGRRRPG